MKICKGDSAQDKLSKLKLEAEMMRSSIIAEQPNRLKDFIANHQKDLELYEFKCERYGDFLSVFISRGEEMKRDYWWQKESNKIAASLSLIGSREIKLIEGLAPNILGQGYFVSNGPVPMIRYKPDISYKKMLMLDPVEKNNQGFMSFGDGELSLGLDNIDNCASPGEDDRIRIEGCGATIYAPTGKGKMVYDKILKAIKLGTIITTT